MGSHDDRRLQVLSRDLIVPDQKETLDGFRAFALRMKRHLRPNATLSYNMLETTSSLAKRCHARRLREAGLTRVKEDLRNELIALARSGGKLVGPTSLDEVDILAARLHAESPWMFALTTFLMRHMRGFVRSGGVGLHLPPIILAGPPGVGKSWWARSVAGAAGLPLRLIDVGSGTAAFRVAGTEKGWGTAQPGLPVECVLSAHVANPVMLVDEIDKAGTVYSTSGSPSSLTTALLQFLDPGTAPRFECPFARVTFDMSRVIWVLTANDPDRIPAPLRDRCRVFHMPEITSDMAIQFFDRIAQDIGDNDGLKAEARAFVAGSASGPNRLSLRQIGQVVEILRSIDDGDILQ
ncbi:AAA family ATPase [Defluviimonas sp. WL0024]|uniref:AAA family ATPase n=1 Tax=Albidovulum salinarum TaxID=2984153 RepID=A0ABT2X3C5_9RHOB|nr:AAA family ATPase [Defluviimonas sp. WL0024]MCU9847824.1 AAA family ATPase [Defluviimonas sp. WL0024]